MGSATVSPLEVVCRKLAERLFKMFGIGELPKDYKPKVHGPYDPAVYYGPKDKAFGNVKLAELPGWLGRRGMYTPMGINRAMSRAFWRWNHKYMLPKYAGVTGTMQLAAGACVFFYLINITKYWEHRNFKHQW